VGKDLPSQSELSGSSEIDCAATEAPKRIIIDSNFILKKILGSWGYARSGAAREASVREFLQGRFLEYLYDLEGNFIIDGKVEIVFSPNASGYILIDHL
jgi:hypothetical protein